MTLPRWRSIVLYKIVFKLDRNKNFVRYINVTKIDCSNRGALLEYENESIVEGNREFENGNVLSAVVLLRVFLQT